ncbi:MAG: S9 family peptidase [Ignavibacteria bacterium]|nr:S9 family peptidase [Ignavibacteria bacterium]
MKKRFGLFILLTSLLSGAPESPAQSKRPLELSDMFNIRRVSQPSVSPDGSQIVYTVTIPSLGSNKNASDLWVISADGTNRRQLTTDPANDRNAAWSPDGRLLAFESTRTGISQIWLIGPDGGEPIQLTSIATGASEPVWSPDGNSIAFVSEVFPEYSRLPFRESNARNAERLDSLENGIVKAKVITGLLYRHWDSWVDGKRKHIFVQPIDGGDPRDVTPGNRDAVPTSSTFSSGIDFAFSPDGTEIAYTATPANTQEEAWSTNHDIYTVPVTGGTPKQLTQNRAADGFPRYSPDGRFLAYRAQSVPGFEADRWQLMIYDRETGTLRSLTASLDASVDSPVWDPTGTRLYFEAQHEGELPLYAVGLDGSIEMLIQKGASGSVSLPGNGSMLVFEHRSAVRPSEVFAIGPSLGIPRQITAENDELFSAIDIPPPEGVWFDGAGGQPIQAWVFKPAGMAEGKRYPFVYMVHGGPQGAWLNSWSYRWNPALWAAQGYVVMAPNPRGSTGFGQDFTNEISGDWGGKVFEDLMKGLDYAETLPYVDPDNKAAAGASYGGYMMNWFQGHAGDRFRTLVTHCGVYNFYSMYGTTEELWFDEWDHGGTPWDAPEGYERFSPHKYAKNFNTPNLVIHNELDYRVPFSEGMQLFTTLQRKGIPSKLLYFPDEGHWVNKPANSKLWHTTVFEWLGSYLSKGDIIP